jgi:dipeptidase
MLLEILMSTVWLPFLFSSPPPHRLEGLIIGESTFGGLVQLACTRRTGLMDYGSLIWVTLQRARNAREAIEVMDYLVQTYGYASTGESFSIGDANELWIMELIGKGRHGKGAVWVARRIPDGYVSGHANQARITTFPLDDSENCLYSPDVISFARDIGLYPSDAPDTSFSFSDIYDPINFDGARFCDARVWSFFSTVMGEEWSNQYLDYATGTNLTNRMPLWVQPLQKLSLSNVMESMRNHYEGTSLDNTGRLFSDIGSGAFHNPNRNSPIVWQTNTYQGEQFFNERTIAQPPTGWSIVMQSRPNFPKEMTAVLWYGIDDSSTSVHYPLYGSATRISKGWAGLGPQDGVTPPLMKFSLDSAFYVFNLVANFAYSRWNAIYPDLYQEIISKETEYMKLLQSIDEIGQKMFEEKEKEDKEGKDPQKATKEKEMIVEYLTEFSEKIGDQLLKEWFEVFGKLFVKYRDGYVTLPDPKNPVCGCSTSSLPYEEEWYNRVVEDTGDRYLYPEDGDAPIDVGRIAIAKRDLRSFR